MNKDSNIIIRIDYDIKNDFYDLVYEKGYTKSLVLSSFIYGIVENKKV